MSYIQNNDPYKEKTATEFLDFFSDKEVNNTQNSKKDIDAYSSYKNSVFIKYLKGQKKNKRKNTKPLDTLIETESDTDSRQTQDKLKTNPRQTQDKLKTNPRQTQDKLKTNLRQTQDKLKTNLRQTQDKLKTQPKTQPKTKFRQNLRQKHSVYSLKGLAKDIMLFIFDICQKTGEKTTPPLTVKTIAESTKSNSKSIPKTIQRLINQKGFLSRYNYEDGRGGFTQYSISSSVFTELRNMTENQAKPKTQPKTQPKTNFSSSSSININNNNITTTNNMEFENFFKNLQELNPSILLNSQNVRKNEILNIYNARSSITPEEFVNSLEDFCYDIENGILKNITIPRSLFVKIMKMENYESEIRVKKDTEIIEQQRIRKDKAKQDLLEKQIALFPDEYDKALKSWINSLSDNDYKDLFGIEKDSSYFLNKDRVIEAKFREIEWPNIFKELNS